MHSLRTLCGYHSCAYLSIYSARLTCIVILTPFFFVPFLQLLFLWRPSYPNLSGDHGPLVFIQHPMVSDDKRSSKVEFLQGDPEDREKVLVPHVDVYRYYCWDDYSFDFTCTILVASEWVRLGCDFSLVVSVVFLKKI